MIPTREQARARGAGRMAALSIACSCALPVAAQETAQVLIAEKALICGAEGRETINHAAVVIVDGRIEAIGRAGAVEFPEGAVVPAPMAGGSDADLRLHRCAGQDHR